MDGAGDAASGESAAAANVAAGAAAAAATGTTPVHHHHVRNARKKDRPQAQPGSAVSLQQQTQPEVQPHPQQERAQSVPGGRQELIPALSSLNVVDTGLVEEVPHPVLQAIANFIRQTGAMGTASRQMTSGQQQPQAPPVREAKAPEKVMFVTWIAFGAAGDGGFKTHNFHKVDMR